MPPKRMTMSRNKRNRRPSYATNTYQFFSSLAVTTSPSVVNISAGEIDIDHKRPWKVLSVSLEYSSDKGCSSFIYLLLDAVTSTVASSRHHNISIFPRKLSLRMPYNIPFLTTVANYQFATIFVSGSTTNVSVAVTGVVRVAYKPQIDAIPVQLFQKLQISDDHSQDSFEELPSP
jgi:hypothetical protein